MRYKGTSENPDKRTKPQSHKTTKPHTDKPKKSKWKLRDLLFLFFMLCFLSFFGGPIGPSVFTLIFWVCGFVRLSFCPFFRIFGYSLIFHELLDKTYIYAHHQNKLNKWIKMMCFIDRFSVYFSRNQRKCSQNGEDGNFKM